MYAPYCNARAVATQSKVFASITPRVHTCEAHDLKLVESPSFGPASTVPVKRAHPSGCRTPHTVLDKRLLIIHRGAHRDHRAVGTHGNLIAPPSAEFIMPGDWGCIKECPRVTPQFRSRVVIEHAHAPWVTCSPAWGT